MCSITIVWEPHKNMGYEFSRFGFLCPSMFVCGWWFLWNRNLISKQNIKFKEWCFCDYNFDCVDDDVECLPAFGRSPGIYIASPFALPQTFSLHTNSFFFSVSCPFLRCRFLRYGTRCYDAHILTVVCVKRCRTRSKHCWILHWFPFWFAAACTCWM